MKIPSSFRTLARRFAGPPEHRRTAALPSIFNTYSPRSDVLPKPTPVNLRRFAETPVARKAINTIKDRIAGMRWQVQLRAGSGTEPADAEQRIRYLTQNFNSPNNEDSFRSLAEQVLEDIIVGGFGAIEMESTGDPQKQLLLWPVDGATIRIKGEWDGAPSTGQSSSGFCGSPVLSISIVPN